MHGHIPAVGNAGPQYAEDALFMYIANGATTVRGMQGNPSQFELRRRIEAGEIAGPLLYLGSPPLSGNNAKDAESASKLVRDHKAAGYDLLKVHEGLTREAYAAIASTAREVGLTWGGHVASDVAVSGALAEHQISIDHIDDYIDALQKDGSPALSLDGFARADAMPMNVDESKYAVLARQTRDAGVTIVPTSALWETILGVHPTADLMKRPELKYMPRAMVEGWATTIDRRRMDRDRMSASMEVRVRNRMLKALDDGGAMILMGTDAPQLFSVPGFSLRNELVVMKQAGMSNYSILRSGTTNVAKYFGTEAETGTVAAGKRADLLLLDANPLADVMNIWKRSGVMANGRWYPESEIQERLAEIVARNR
jgi:imidazolonepropionase-like amidohydrolase